jgi:hypothetical protein
MNDCPLRVKPHPLSVMLQASVQQSMAVFTRCSDVEVVLRPDQSRHWMSKSVAFQKLIEDRLFFSAQAENGKWTIAVSRISNGRPFDSTSVRLEHQREFSECITPALMRVPGGYIMAFAGRTSVVSARKIFLAKSTSLDGPWIVTESCYSPNKPWEGRSIDLGPGTFQDERYGYVFYSCAGPTWRSQVFAWARSPCMPTRSSLMRFARRRIGILRINLRTLGIEAFLENPLPLNADEGSISESVFCPGYANIDRLHLLATAASRYSDGPPFTQAICIAYSELAPHFWTEKIPTQVLISSADLPGVLSRKSAFDTPDLVPVGRGLLEIYFSAMSRDIGQWHILRCTVKIDQQ